MPELRYEGLYCPSCKHRLPTVQPAAITAALMALATSHVLYLRTWGTVLGAAFVIALLAQRWIRRGTAGEREGARHPAS